jgi:hypothetical protein
MIMLGGLVMTAMLTNTTFESLTRHWLSRTGFAANDFWYMRLERMFTSAFVTAGGKDFWTAVFWIAFSVGLAEWICGGKRAAATFWGIHLLSLLLLSLIITLALHQLHQFGLQASEAARDVGPSVGYFACLGLVSSRLKTPWNLLSGEALFAIFVIAMFLPAASNVNAAVKFSADLAHMLAFPLGWLSSAIGRGRLQNLKAEAKA